MICLLQACSSGGSAASQPFAESLTLSGEETISIELHAGKLEIGPAADQKLGISGSLFAPGSLLIDQSDTGIEIIHTKSQADDILQVQIPEGSILKVKTFSADVNIMDFSGDLMVSSSAGKIAIDRFSGLATVWAGRGEIAAADSRGEMILISEHGAVNVETFEGELSMSTIMGSLAYNGAENDQNIVRLEADHGSVTVSLPGSANTTVSAASTSGEVICIGPGITHTVDGCQIVAGSGTGSITIRTVSGRVEVRMADGMGAD